MMGQTGYVPAEDIVAGGNNGYDDNDGGDGGRAR